MKARVKDIKYAALSPDGIDGSKIVENHLLSGRGNLESAFKTSIERMAKIDRSVNTNCFSQTVSL